MLEGLENFTERPHCPSRMKQFSIINVLDAVTNSHDLSIGQELLVTENLHVHYSEKGHLNTQDEVIPAVKEGYNTGKAEM